MLSDIRDFRLLKRKEGEYFVKDIDIKDMKRTKELVGTLKII